MINVAQKNVFAICDLLCFHKWMWTSHSISELFISASYGTFESEDIMIHHFIGLFDGHLKHDCWRRPTPISFHNSDVTCTCEEDEGWDSFIVIMKIEKWFHEWISANPSGYQIWQRPTPDSSRPGITQQHTAEHSIKEINSIADRSCCTK